MEETKDPILNVRSMIIDQAHLEDCEEILEQQYDVNALQDRKKRLYIKMVLSQTYDDDWKHVYSMLKKADIKNILRIVRIQFPLFIFDKVRHLQYALQLVIKLEDNNVSVDFIRVMIHAFTANDNLIGMINYLLSRDTLPRLLHEGKAAEEIIQHAREGVQR